MTISANIGVIEPSAEGGYVGYIPEVPGCITQGETIEECREMLRDALRSWAEVAMNQWISVKEQMPKEGQLVDVVYRYDKDSYIYRGTSVFYRDNQFGMYARVTHWMPVPALPK